jgi:hypothetical protein
MKERHPAHQTQWAAQFAVASELCKRSYQVALTMGNHPIVDLMVISPKGKSFQIDVKGLYKPSFWLVKPKEPRDELFYVFAHVPAGYPNEFFVMTQRQVNKAIQANWDNFCTKHGRPLSDISENRMPGVEWKLAKKYVDKWDALPA